MERWKNIKQMRGDSTTYLTAGRSWRPWCNKDVQVENGSLIQALFHLTRNIHILTQMDVFFFFFPFPCAGKINYIFFFLKKMSACSAGDDGGICTSPRWMFSSPCVWPWIRPEFPLSVFQRHWKFPSTK